MKIKIINEGNEYAYILMDKGEYIGCCCVSYDYLHSFQILEEYRGHKYGKYLFQRVISYHKKQCLRLLVRTDNMIARRIYEKAGFIINPEASSEEVLSMVKEG